MATERDLTFDIMKGIGILLVLLGHTWGIPEYLHQAIFSFHMPMFFIVAGYFSKSYHQVNDKLKTIKKYFRRLVVPFLFTSLLFIIFFVLLSVAKNDWNIAIRSFCSVFHADIIGLETPFGRLAIGVMWFLLALFWSKVFLLYITKYPKYTLLISFGLSIGALLLHKVLPYSIWCLSISLVALPFVAIGWWLRNYKVTIPIYIKIFLVVCWVYVIIKMIVVDMYEYRWDFYPLNLLGALGGTYALYAISLFINKKLKYTAKVLSYLGFISLAIVCFHNLELDTNLRSRLLAFIPIQPSYEFKVMFSYIITIIMAVGATKLPVLRNIYNPK